ncbi:MAG: hypothetical protein WDO71_23455 [Bacteroidota bacterium]
MNRTLKIAAPLKIAKRIIVIACLLVTLFFPASLFSQTDSAQAIVPEEEALVSPTIDFISVQKSDNTIDLKAILKAKIKGHADKIARIEDQFFLCK